MEPAPLAQAGGGGVQARTADLQSLASGRYPKSSQTPETPLKVAGCETARSPSRHTRQSALCLMRHKANYAASLIILSTCRNSVVSLTFCSLLRGIIRSHGKGVKIRQKLSNEVFPYLRGYKWSLFATLGIANALRIMPD